MGLFIVMEHMDSDLKKVMNISSKMQLTEAHVQTLLYNLICALKFLHSANVMHRDLKPANVLVNNDCEVKICDFGLARTLSDSLIG
jgi:serine/threonine protein kinase